MCEDCGKNAHFGLKGGKKQWCSGCAKRHDGVRLGKRRMCEDCKGKHANYGLPDTTQRRWCGPCAERHGGVLRQDFV